jgi:D-arabinose 1-dehydrogenase-like Zn-dependent alcohol dehydrogenase
MENKTVGNLEDMMQVANNCQGYEAMNSGLTSAVGASNCKSCKNCKHLKENKCESNLYDGVLASIDEW